MSLSTPARLRAASAVTLAVALAATGCDTAKKSAKSDSSSTTTTSAAESVDIMTEAQAAVDLAYDGSFGTPPETGPKGVADKKLWIITCSDALESCSAPGHYAEDAAKELGWKVTYAEGQLQATVTSERIRSAVADNADAIILVGSDCPQVQAPLQEARDAGVVVVGIYAFDCDDPTIENGKPLFNASAKASVGGDTTVEQQRTWGKIKADWTIVQSKGAAKFVQLNANERLVIRHTNEGFDEEFAKCTGCEEIGRVEATDSDILQLAPALAKGQAVLSQHPEATFTHAPIDAIVPLLVLPAITGAGLTGKVQIVGGEGLPANIELIRNGQQAMALAYPHDWMAWSAVDIVNRIFAEADYKVDQGISWVLIDKDHNLPESGPYVAEVDFKAAYRKVWGVTAP